MEPEFKQPCFSFVVIAPGKAMMEWLLSVDSTECDAWLATLRGIEDDTFDLVYDLDDGEPDSPEFQLVIFGDDALFGLKLEEKLKQLFGQGAAA